MRVQTVHTPDRYAGNVLEASREIRRIILRHDGMIRNPYLNDGLPRPDSHGSTPHMRDNRYTTGCRGKVN